MKHPLILGADHAGFELKEQLKKILLQQGEQIEDASPAFIKDDDYPLVAQRVAYAVSRKTGAYGILICGSGLGMDIAANRFHGIRATLVRTPEEACLAREHTHANILVLGAWITPLARAKNILTTWLHTSESRAKRHLRRVEQLDAL